MTREDVLNIFPNATPEEITRLLNQSNAELTKEKKKAEQYKDEASKSAELQKMIDEINDKNLTEVEKANKATESANNMVAELQKQINAMKIENELAKLGITENIFAEDGSLDFTVLGEVISTREKKAVADFEKKSLEQTPDGNSVGTQAPSKTDAEKVAESIFKATDTKASSDIINAYA